MELLVEPLEVINVRSSTQPGQVGTEVLIRWKGLPAFEDSWEKFEFLMEKFPHVNLEDKVRVWAAGNVRPPTHITYVRRKKQRCRFIFWGYRIVMGADSYSGVIEL